MTSFSSFLRQSICRYTRALTSTIFVLGACGIVLCQDPFKHDELTRGPLSFTQLKGTTFNLIAERDRNGIIFEDFRWTASSGKFKYRNDKGVVIEGDVIGFSLRAERSKALAGNIPILDIRKGGLTFTLRISKQLNFTAYGGNIVLAAKEEMLISNSEQVTITGSGLINQTGTLALTTFNKLDWQGAKFRFPQIPSDVPMTFMSDKGIKKEYDLPLGTGNVVLTDAQFLYVIPRTFGQKPFSLKTPDYIATLYTLRLKELSVHLNRSGATMRAEDFGGSGEITVKTIKSSPIPVLFSGNAMISTITGKADFSPVLGEVKDIRLRGLRLHPLAGPAANANRSNFESSAAIPGKRSLQNSGRAMTFTHALFQSHTTQPNTKLIPSDCYLASSSQLSAMNKLGLKSLTQRQLEAIRGSKEVLDKVSESDFLIHLPAEDIKILARKLALEKLSIDPLEMKFGKQEILVCGDFSSALPALNLPSLDLVYRISPSIELADVERNGKSTKEFALVLRYEIGQTTIDDTEINNETSPEEIENAVSNKIGESDAITKEPTSSYALPLPLDFIRTIDVNKSYTDANTNDKFTLKSKKVETTVSAIPEGSVLFIDNKGIHLLGKLIVKAEVKQ